jgi:glycosyltransferase involved in cell wall biosynthesis
MQIIYVHTVDIGKPSTAINFVFYNALALANNGANVHLMFTNSSNEPALDLLKKHFDEEIPENLHLHSFSYKKKEHFKLYKRVLKKVKELETKDTIFITRTIGIMPHLFLFSRKGYKMNVFFELHDFFYDLKLKNAPSKNINPRKKRYYERHYFKHTKGLICLNSAYKDLYSKYFKGDHLQVFHTGLNQIVKKEVKRKNQLVYIGSVDNNKYAIEDIFKVASMTNSDISYLIIGGQNQNQIDFLNGLTEKYQVSEKLTIVPWTTRDHISKILSESKIGMLALRNTFSNRHSIPLKLLDYYSHGLAVIAPPYHAFEELLTASKHGYYLDWETDHEKIARQIEVICENDNKFEELSEAVYTKAEELTWDKRAQKQIAFFRNFLASKSTHK